MPDSAFAAHKPLGQCFNGGRFNSTSPIPAAQLINRRPAAVQLKPAIAGRTIFFQLILASWTFLCLSGGLSAVHALRLDLVAGTVLSVLLISRPVFDTPITYFSILGSIALCGFYTGTEDTALIWSAKLAVIFLLTSALRARHLFCNGIHYGIRITALTNGALVCLSLLGFSFAAGVISAAGRESTVLTTPGALARTGMLALFYYLYLLCAAKTYRGLYFAALALCLLCIWRDGSRIAMIIALLSPIAGCLVLFMEGWRVRALTALGLISCAIAILFTSQSLVSETNPLARSSLVLERLKSFDIARLDPVRYDLLTHSAALIIDHPFIGNGLMATALRGHELGSPAQPVHNAYVQLWAEAGLLGFLAFLNLMWGWVMRLPALFDRMRYEQDAGRRALVYNAVFILMYSGLHYLVHPIGTEWGDWVGFVFARSSLLHLTDLRSRGWQ